MIDCIRGIDKNECPNDCSFKYRESRIVKIPPPNRIEGVIISRDPPNAWSHFYEYASTIPQEETKRKVLFAGGIPLKLVDRIMRFKEGNISSDKKHHLFDWMFQRTYWTHFHKCFTDEAQEDTKFKEKNGKNCANCWLKKELKINTKDRIVVALGKHVEKWVKGMDEFKELKIIYLPHPSGQNASWYDREKYNDIKDSIEDLLKAIN